VAVNTPRSAELRSSGDYADYYFVDPIPESPISAGLSGAQTVSSGPRIVAHSEPSAAPADPFEAPEQVFGWPQRGMSQRSSSDDRRTAESRQRPRVRLRRRNHSW